jgi:Fe-S-cluster containining protein
MPLTLKDIRRIQKKGYKPSEFIVKRNGERQLRNIEGLCFFLEKGRCTIYRDRPEGCRIYPLIFDENCKRVIIDTDCSHHEEFSINPISAEKLRKLIRVIDREKSREIL